MAPKKATSRVPAAGRRDVAIALGPAASAPVMAGAGMAHV
jgi:hypothetical protein